MVEVNSVILTFDAQVGDIRFEWLNRIMSVSVMVEASRAESASCNDALH